MRLMKEERREEVKKEGGFILGLSSQVTRILNPHFINHVTENSSMESCV